MKSTVLIVDDERDFVDLLEYKFKRQGYEVLTAVNGQDALRKASRTVPSVILLDLMLPDIDGISICEILRSNPPTAQVPVVMLSQLDSQITRVRGTEAGVTRYFNKSVDLGDLEECVRSLVA